MNDKVQITFDVCEDGHYGVVIWWKRLPNGDVFIINEGHVKDFKPIPTES